MLLKNPAWLLHLLACDVQFYSFNDVFAMDIFPSFLLHIIQILMTDF